MVWASTGPKWLETVACSRTYLAGLTELVEHIS